MMGAGDAICRELLLLAESLAVGVFLMIAYDGLRLFRFLVRHGTFWTGIEDVVYWGFSSLVTFQLLLRQNDGTLRWYAVGGVLLGMAAYNFTVSRILFALLKKIQKYFTIKRSRRKREEVTGDAKDTEDSGQRESAQKKAGEPQ